MIRTRPVAACALAATALLFTTAGGCGSSGPSGSSTQVTVKGNPDATHKCKTILVMQHPVAKQLTATYTVTCNFTIASADTSLVIQGRPIGSGNTSWDNISDPRKSTATTGISLTYAVPCITSLEYQASGQFDALADDGTPATSSDTTTPRSYGASECSGS